MYGEKAEGVPDICPGEVNCNRFQGANGKTRLAKERNACRPCELFPTKIDGYKKSQESFERLVNGAMEVRRCRNSGYPLETWQMMNLEFMTLMQIDAYEEREKLALQMKTNHLLIVGLGLKPQ